jgi:YD repeat-containing protein
LRLAYLWLILSGVLPAACRDCAQVAFGGPRENPFTAYDAICRAPGCREPGLPQVYVSAASLTLFVRVTDLAFGGPAPALLLEHSFNMDDAQAGALGVGWSFSLGDNLTPDTDGTLLLRRGSGRVDRFATASGAAAYFAVSNTRDTLTRAADGTYQLRSADSPTVWNFRADGRLASIQDGSLKRVTLDYDASGNLATAVYRGRTIRFTSDGQGRIVQIDDAEDRTVAFTYSDDGRLSGQTNADGTSTGYEYDGAGNLSAVTYAGGRYAIAYSGDAPYVSVASVTTPDGAVRQYDIPRTPSEIRVTDGNGDATLYGFTAKGLLQYVQDAAGNKSNFKYDASGNRTSATNATGETTSFTYDSAGRLTGITDPASNRWTAEYANGLLTRLTDPRRNAWTFQYDAAGNLTGAIDPLAGTIAVTRNASGQITSLTDVSGAKTVYQYGADGLPSEITDALGNKTAYAYDGAARPNTRTDAGGRTLSVTYTENGRISGMAVNDAVLGFDYSGLKRDAQGRLTSYTDSFGNTIGYRYDAAGQLTALTLPGDKTVTYTYDHQNRLRTVSDWAGNSALYSYDAAGYPISLSTAGGPVTVWQYDTGRNLRTVLSTGPDGTPVAGYRYTVDAAGNRTGVSALEPLENAPALPSYEYTYNSIRLPVGRSDGENYSYDSLANLTGISGSRTAAVNYDIFGRVSGVSGQAATAYGYDSTGLRVTRDARRTIWDPSGARPRPVMETDSSGAVTAWYVYGLGLLWKVAADGTPYFYHFDGDGNVVAMSNTVAGVVNKYRYGPGGNLIAMEESVDNPFRARGELGWIDDGNGLIFTGTEFRYPDLRLVLPAAADPAPPAPETRPGVRGLAACFFEGVSGCGFSGGRKR